jgi:hypothetical protein
MLPSVLAVVLLWSWVLSPALSAHPLHTALTEISYQTDSQTVAIRIRVFADDLASSVSGLADAAQPDSALSRYARGSFALTDRSGRPVPLRWERAERAGDMVLLQLRATLAGGLAQSRVLDALLCERFPDQINIVRASYGGRTITLLFTRGDAAKVLP